MKTSRLEKLKKNAKVSVLFIFIIIQLILIGGILQEKPMNANAYIGNNGWFYVMRPEQYDMPTKVSAGTISEYKLSGNTWISANAAPFNSLSLEIEDIVWTFYIERYVYSAAYWDDEIQYGLIKVIDTSNETTFASINFRSGREKNDASRYIITANANIKWNTAVSYRIEAYVPGKNGEKYKIIWTLPSLNLIDTTAPVGKFTGAQKLPNSDNSYFGTNVSFSWNFQNNNEAGVYCKINGEVSKQKNFTEENTYNIELWDYAGNKSIYVLYIDKTAPTYSIKSNGVSMDSGGYATNIDFSAEDKISGLKEIRYRSPSGTTYSTKTNSVRLPSNSQNGKWEFWAEDNAGNISTAYAYIDTVAAVGIFDNVIKTTDSDNEYYALAGKNAMIRWLHKNESESPISLRVNGSAVSTTISGDYDCYTFTQEGNFEITLIDSCGNQNNYKLIVDRTAPVISMNCKGIFVAAGGYATNIQVTVNDGVSGLKLLYYKSPDGIVRTTANASINITSAPMNGRWTFWAEDIAGNLSDLNSAYAYLDTTAPTNGNLERHTNTSVTYSPYDALAGVSEVYFKMPGTNTYSKASGLEYTIQATKINFGEWSFYSVDSVGNISQIINTTISVVNTFGNLFEIKNNYKVNEWWQVVLPSRIFSKEAGTYTFSNEDAALTFAVKKEVQFRCSKVENGWVYVNATNESVSQVYTNKDELDAVILKYAEQYVSDRQILKNGNNNYYTQMNDLGVLDAEALTWQRLVLPVYLNSYKNLPLYLCSEKYIFNYLQLSYISRAENAHSVSARYLADDVRLILNGSLVNVDFGNAFGNSLKNANAYKQGYYLIRETDICGNIEEYLIYLDLQTSQLSATGIFGDGESKALVFNSEFIEEYAGTLYYVSLELDSLIDNADGMICVNIYNTKKSYRFTQGDKLPILNATFGSGKWTIEIFDRSFNILTFEVNIAGDEPYWTYSSLKNQTKCTITFNSGGSGNAITSLKLYKIDADGNFIAMIIDDDGKKINFMELTYTIKNGGKYSAEITDLYGRIVQTKPIFYMKDLPEGYLSCNEGTRTNKNVTFEYSGGNSLIVYQYQDGKKITVTNYTTEYNNKNDTYRITIAATNESSYEYLLFLHKGDDRSIFVEYSFTIDCIMANIHIQDKDGNSIEFDSVTNKPFSLNWAEAINVRYWKSSTVGGETNAEKYMMNSPISADGLYYFIGRDSVGNEIKFSVLLDTKVSYQVDGKYNLVNGEVVANNPIIITVLEVVDSWIVENVDGYTFSNGGTLVRDGRYLLKVTDSYGNSLTLVFVLDTQPPKLELDRVENGGKTNNSVTITSDEQLYLTDKKGNIIKDIESGSTFSEGGTYYIKAEDVAGNVTLKNFTIDTFVEYTLSVPNGLMTSANNISLVFSENVTLHVTLDGTAIEAGRYKVEGHYVVVAADEVGNIVTLDFTVIPSRTQRYSMNLPEGVSIAGIKLNGSNYELFMDEEDEYQFEISGIYIVTLINNEGEYNDCVITIDNVPPTVELRQDKESVKLLSASKENCKITVERNGKTVDGKIGSTFNQAGSYTVIITDDLGNTSTLTFVIDYRINTVGIFLCFLGVILGTAVITIIVLARRKPRVR